MHSIRVRITAITIAAILTSILSVIGASFFTIEEENDRSLTEVMNLIGQNTQKSLEKYLDSIEQSVEMAANIATERLDSIVLIENGVYANAPGQKERTPRQTAALDAYLSEYCADVQEAFSSLAGHTRGVVTYYYCINPEVSQNEHGFFYSRVGKTGFDEQKPLDARTLDPADIEHTTWYYTTIERGRPSWIGPYTAHFLDELITYSYIVPIYKAGTLIGVLGMDIPFETLVSLVESIRVFDTGFACLFDTDGRVLYHPTLSFGSTPDGAAMAAVNADMLLRDSSGGKPIRYSVDGEERQLSFSTLSNGMKLAVIAPMKELNASWTRLTGIILLATTAIVALFSVILLFVMRVITRPLSRLTAASERLAGGDYDVELEYRGRDEVGTLTRAFSRMRDHLKRYIADLNRRAFTDELTGLPNMSRFFELAADARITLLDEGKKPVMLFFDLIGMKYYNRQYGFEEGNRLICALGEILCRHFGRKNCSRFGQDHFTAVADEDVLEQKLQAVFAECERLNGGRSLPVRVGVYPDSLGAVSVGVACDRAKYACDQHRGSYESGFYYFDEAMLNQIADYQYIIGNLNRALEERWIKVYFQPIVRATNGKVCDEEALSRWIDPERGMLSPAQFIPILEGARLIYKLDLYVLDQILLKMQEQAQAGLHVVPQSLNLSRADFDACDIVEEVRRRVDAAGIPREKLTIEVTESSVGSDFDFMKSQIERFQALGFPVWMDDFGSGYSALDVLQSIHFDLIKFDMRFMQRFEEGDECRIILTELTRMAHGLGIETVAEGVETQAQVDFLREVGCTKLQGFYFCRAIPLEEIVERNRKGIQIGFENPAETGYYTAIGRINLYDLSSVGSGGVKELGKFFDTMPMAIIEFDENHMRLLRCNKSYREFLLRSFGGIEKARPVGSSAPPDIAGAPFVKALAQCREEGTRVFVDETLPNGTAIHALLWHLAVNPVTGVVACVAVLLGVTDPPSDGD